MNLERYELDVRFDNTKVKYEFFSQGSKGLIKKIICFEKVDDTYCNLSFGDHISGTEEFSDEITSNNGDTEIVIATVAEAISNFSREYPHLTIYVEGSSLSRSRLYRICINKHKKIVSKDFFIYGKLANNEWEKFKNNRNYIAFAGSRKNP